MWYNILRMHKKEADGLLLRECTAIDEAQARLRSPLQLAHLGDAVWTLLIRERLMVRGRNVHNMHRDAVAGVNAHAQTAALGRMEPLLIDAERDIVRRGRNAHARHPAPRHQDPADYAQATALEALVGYLYLTGQEERLLFLFAVSQEEEACRK